MLRAPCPRTPPQIEDDRPPPARRPRRRGRRLGRRPASAASWPSPPASRSRTAWSSTSRSKAARAAKADDVRVFALDTGRLPDETYMTAERVRMKYGVEIEWLFPRARAGREADPAQGALQLPRLAREPSRVLRHPQGRAAGPRAGRPRRLDDGPAQRAVGHAHRHARDRDRRRARRHREAEPDRRAGRWPRSAPTPTSTASRSTRCTIAATRRSAAPPARARSSPASTRAPAAGGGRIPRTRSAGSTSATCRSRTDRRPGSSASTSTSTSTSTCTSTRSVSVGAEAQLDVQAAGGGAAPPRHLRARRRTPPRCARARSDARGGRTAIPRWRADRRAPGLSPRGGRRATGRACRPRRARTA